MFVGIAEDVLDGGGLISRDRSVLAWFVDHRSDTSIAIARALGTVGGFVGLSVVAVGVGWWLWTRRVRVALVVAPAVALAVASLASTVTKAAVDRARPPLSLHSVPVSLAAFPSGHATSSSACLVAASTTVAVAVVRRRRLRVVLVAAGLAGAGLVGISRLVLAVHWLSDVVAGWALGTAVAVSVVVVCWYLAASGDRDHAAPAVDS